MDNNGCFVRFLGIEQNENFVHSASDALSYVESKLCDYPHTFDHTLNYVVERFGKYVPYIVTDSFLLHLCMLRCELAFGFVPEFDVLTEGLHDFDDPDLSDPEPDLPFTSVGSDDQFSIDYYV